MLRWSVEAALGQIVLARMEWGLPAIVRPLLSCKVMWLLSTTTEGPSLPPTLEHPSEVGWDLSVTQVSEAPKI